MFLSLFIFYLIFSNHITIFYIIYIFLNTCVNYKVFWVYKVHLKEFCHAQSYSVFMGKLYIILTACSRLISIYTHTQISVIFMHKMFWVLACLLARWSRIIIIILRSGDGESIVGLGVYGTILKELFSLS